MTEALADEMRREGHTGVKFTYVCPMFVDTGLTKHSIERDYRPRKMAFCRECLCDSASCLEPRQEAESRRQPLQEAIYHVQKSEQDARDRKWSRQKPNMIDSFCRKQKLVDWFIPCADRFGRMLTPHEVAEAAINGALTEEMMVTVPAGFKSRMRIAALLSRKFVVRLNKFLGLGINPQYEKRE